MDWREQTQQNIERQKRILELGEKYPDLRKMTDRWDRIRYASVSINAECDEVEIRHACGCCSDSPLLAYPYKEIEGIPIYAVCSNCEGFEEPCVCIGEQNAWGFGEIPNPNWEEDLREQNLSEIVIEKVRKYLEEHPPEEMDDEDYDALDNL